MLIKELNRVLGHSSGQTHVFLSSCIPVSQRRLLSRLDTAEWSSKLLPCCPRVGWFCCSDLSVKSKDRKNTLQASCFFQVTPTSVSSTLHSLVSFVLLQRPLERASHTEGCPNKHWLRGSVGNTRGGRKERGSSRPTEGLLFPGAQRHTEQLKKKKITCRNML